MDDNKKKIQTDGQMPMVGRNLYRKWKCPNEKVSTYMPIYS